MAARHVTRRRPRGRIQRLGRLIRYRLLIPVLRSRHPAEFTARGVAIGIFWGMTPFIGFQTALMLGTWFVLRRVFHRDSSIVQALIWAWVNNPITMIPMYYVFYLTGMWMMGAHGSASGYAAFAGLWNEGGGFFESALRLARLVGMAVSLGCIPYAAVCSWIGYRWAIDVIRLRRRARGTARAAL